MSPNLEVVRAWMQACNGDDVEDAYLFTIRDGRLLRQDAFDDKAQALQAAGLGE
jgi:hypothetical protein